VVSALISLPSYPSAEVSAVFMLKKKLYDQFPPPPFPSHTRRNNQKKKAKDEGNPRGEIHPQNL